MAHGFAVLLLALPAGGCFQPLYGEAVHPRSLPRICKGDRGSKFPIKATNPVAAFQDDYGRIAHYLGDDLLADINGTGSTPEPKYRLTVTFALSTATPTVTSQIQVANAATVTVAATFNLTAVGGGAPLMTSTATSVAVYDRTEDRFANLRATRDAEIRVSKSLAEEIELRVAAYLGESRNNDAEMAIKQYAATGRPRAFAYCRFGNRLMRERSIRLNLIAGGVNF